MIFLNLKNFYQKIKKEMKKSCVNCVILKRRRSWRQRLVLSTFTYW